MTVQSFRSGSAFPPAFSQPHRARPIHSAAAGSNFGDELLLKMLMVAAFLPEGLSFFIGDFRLSLARAVLIILCIAATARAFSGAHARVPSDAFALLAGIWMMLATAVTEGFVAALKGGAATALEFTGAYFVFRYLLGPVDSSVRVVRFACKLLIPIVALALLDPLTGRLFTYEIIKGLTGYVKVAYEVALASHAQSIFRDGLVRAMGPLEHSILFGAVCVWLGALALITFPSRLFGWSVAAVALIGVWFSQARGPLLGYAIACALALYYVATTHFRARWKVLGLLAVVGIVIVFSASGSPIATLMRLFWLSPEAAWYRQAIWEAGLPVVLNSPLVGIGMTTEWGWQNHGALVGSSVDNFWLATAMTLGIPSALFIFLTMAGAFWLGPVDRSHYLSPHREAVVGRAWNRRVHGHPFGFHGTLLGGLRDPDWSSCGDTCAPCRGCNTASTHCAPVEGHLANLRKTVIEQNHPERTDGVGPECQVAERRYQCRICFARSSAIFEAKEMMSGTREVFRYFECPGCGCVQIAEIPDRLDKYYDSTYYSFAAPPPPLYRTLGAKAYGSCRSVAAPLLQIGIRRRHPGWT